MVDTGGRNDYETSGYDPDIHTFHTNSNSNSQLSLINQFRYHNYNSNSKLL